MATVGVYTILNTVTERMYIGSSRNCEKRWRTHALMLRRGTHHSAPLQAAYNKYGKDCFEYSVFEYVSDATNLLSREQVWLNLFRPYYNIAKSTHSPKLGQKMSLETRRKMSESAKLRGGNPWSDEQKKRQSEAKLLNPPKWSAESRRKISESLIGNKRSLGFKHSAETRKKLSDIKLAASSKRREALT